MSLALESWSWQLSSLGQANSPEEFDAYLAVAAETAPEKIISAADEFERRWPHSEMVASVFEIQAEAYRSLGDWEKSVAAARSALLMAPDNLAVLANLAYTIADNPADPQKLVQAETFARRELKLSETIRVPRSISQQQWQDTRAHLDSLAHASLGLVAYKRDDPAEAIREFETAIKLERIPDPAHYYRLGLLYRSSGRLPEAIDMLKRAAASNDPVICRMAEAGLAATSQNQK